MSEVLQWRHSRQHPDATYEISYDAFLLNGKYYRDPECEKLPCPGWCSGCGWVLVEDDVFTDKMICINVACTAFNREGMSLTEILTTNENPHCGHIRAVLASDLGI